MHCIVALTLDLLCIVTLHHHTHPFSVVLILIRVTGEIELIPDNFSQEAAYNLDWSCHQRITGHKQTFIHTHIHSGYRTPRGHAHRIQKGQLHASIFFSPLCCLSSFGLWVNWSLSKLISCVWQRGVGLHPVRVTTSSQSTQKQPFTCTSMDI